jgi:orotate phosphoribosyltransferase
VVGRSGHASDATSTSPLSELSGTETRSQLTLRPRTRTATSSYRAAVPNADLDRQIADVLGATWGHFRYESGHHGDLWLDLDALFTDAQRASRWTNVLADQLPHPQVVLGPLTGGAFLAQTLAAIFEARFVFAERTVAGDAVCYRVPAGQRTVLEGAATLVVDDVINAASAVTATVDDLLECGGSIVALASLASLGDAADRLDAAFDWSPDDPRLYPLADRTQRWIANRHSRSEDAERPVLDPTIAQLVATSAGASSPAWDRLTEIAKQRRDWPDGDPEWSGRGSGRPGPRSNRRRSCR